MSSSSSADWIRRLKIRHLEVFLTLDTSPTLSSAAERMHMTQSAVSHWLSDLEALVGTRLVNRDRGIQLTKAGETFRLLALRVLGDVSRTKEELQAIVGSAPEMLRIGTTSAGAAGSVSGAVIAFQAAYPEIRIRLEEGGLIALVEGLEKRQLDLFVGTLDGQIHKPNLEHVVLRDEELVPIVGRGHPLSRLSQPNWADLADYPWIMPPKGTLVRTIVENIMLQHGRADLHPHVETISFLAMEAMLRETEYVAITSGTVSKHLANFSSLHALPLREGRLPQGVVWRRGDISRTAHSFIQQLRSHHS
ncbi:LysR substrate-binding domain-containing protein [Achromobacter animicus]|uniref:LysR family transcriptional regulator n=1 Tax=Achromobacter animicus TaxID=1389935 RepID=UPI0028AFA627|nr:LysR substrate-binding domain-containing protein [Achromobacter animicus]